MGFLFSLISLSACLGMYIEYYFGEIVTPKNRFSNMFGIMMTTVIFLPHFRKSLSSLS